MQRRRVAGAALPIVESDLAIDARGSCDAAFIHRGERCPPGVLIWPDAFGLRPAMREMGRRLAGEGYAVQQYDRVESKRTQPYR